jgi:anthranilate synthase/aminodeoxychorismate synthase-like glutamine amidotransferase
VKAMELIAQLEGERRNIYGGSVGFFSFDGNIDTSIAIRTMVVKDDIAYLQAGGGIVFDSTEEAEYQETVNKMAATARAVETCKKTVSPTSASSPSDTVSLFNKSLHEAHHAASSAHGVAGAKKSVVSAGVRLAIPEKPAGDVTLMIDNFDSFTWNIYQYLCQLSNDPVVVLRNDATLEQCIALNPKRVVISPGPGWPHEAGVSNDAIKHFLGKVPLLGVCLGHECLVELYGGKIIHCGEIMHGKTSKMYHDGKGVFEGVPDGFEAIRYHSLAADTQVVMPDYDITCKTSNGIIQGIRHRKYRWRVSNFIRSRSRRSMAIR